MAESCGVAHQSPLPSPVAVPARQSLCMESPLESFNKPRQSRPVFVGVTRQALQARPPSQSRPQSSAVHAKVVRCPCQSPAKSADRPVGQGLSPGICAQSARQALSRMSRPRQTTIVRRPRHGRSPPHRLYRLDRPRVFWSALSAVCAGSSAGPARVVRRPRFRFYCFSGGHILPCGF